MTVNSISDSLSVPPYASDSVSEPRCTNSSNSMSNNTSPVMNLVWIVKESLVGMPCPNNLSNNNNALRYPPATARYLTAGVRVFVRAQGEPFLRVILMSPLTADVWLDPTVRLSGEANQLSQASLLPANNCLQLPAEGQQSQPLVAGVVTCDDKGQVVAWHNLTPYNTPLERLGQAGLPLQKLYVFDRQLCENVRNYLLENEAQAIVNKAQPRDAPVPFYELCRFWNRQESSLGGSGSRRNSTPPTTYPSWSWEDYRQARKHLKEFPLLKQQYNDIPDPTHLQQTLFFRVTEEVERLKYSFADVQELYRIGARRIGFDPTVKLSLEECRFDGMMS